ncbi:MAG TPA: hypothetical protein VMU55_09150 [Solirubrobacteraceae bacterium]|nr:hypothetical protein [Solirubrobacteraceae bacterium]
MPDLAKHLSERLAAERAKRREQAQALWKMTAKERQMAMWNDELTVTQLYMWAKARPEEIPLINGEWAFIAAKTPEVAEPEQQEEH